MTVYEKLVNKYGNESQTLKTVEEIAELIKALCNNLYNRQHNAEEEILDVEIMIKQVKVIYGIEDVCHGFRIDTFVDRNEFIKTFIKRSSMFMSNLITGFDSKMDASFYIMQIEYDLETLKTLFDENMLNDWKIEKEENLNRLLKKV